jgi:hypothetical protein
MYQHLVVYIPLNADLARTKINGLRHPAWRALLVQNALLMEQFSQHYAAMGLTGNHSDLELISRAVSCVSHARKAHGIISEASNQSVNAISAMQGMFAGWKGRQSSQPLIRNADRTHRLMKFVTHRTHMAKIALRVMVVALPQQPIHSTMTRASLDFGARHAQHQTRPGICCVQQGTIANPQLGSQAEAVARHSSVLLASFALKVLQP